MTRRLYQLFCVTAIFVSSLFLFDASAKKSKEKVDIYELSLDENINTPELGKQAKNIIAFQNTQVAELSKLSQSGYPYSVTTVRDGEVVKITIPARHLFKPNDVNMCDNGKRILKPLLKYLNTSQLYKMVLTMHSDNTGNETYTLDLTTRRVNAIFDWIGENHKTEYVVPYALGSSDPIKDNNSIANRDANRRLIIYLIPAEIMITQAKRNKISLQ